MFSIPKENKKIIFFSTYYLDIPMVTSKNKKFIKKRTLLILVVVGVSIIASPFVYKKYLYPIVLQKIATYHFYHHPANPLYEISLCGKKYKIERANLDAFRLTNRIAEIVGNNSNHSVCGYLTRDIPEGSTLTITTNGYDGSYLGNWGDFSTQYYLSINKKEFYFNEEENYITMPPHTEGDIIGPIDPKLKIIPNTIVKIVNTPHLVTFCGKEVTLDKEVTVFGNAITSRVGLLTSMSPQGEWCKGKEITTGENLKVSVEAFPEIWQMNPDAFTIKIGSAELQIDMERGVVGAYSLTSKYILGSIGTGWFSPPPDNVTKDKYVFRSDKTLFITLCGKLFEMPEISIDGVQVSSRVSELIRTQKFVENVCIHNQLGDAAYQNWDVVPLNISVIPYEGGGMYFVAFGKYEFTVDVLKNQVFSINGFDGSKEVLDVWKK